MKSAEILQIVWVGRYESRVEELFRSKLKNGKTSFTCAIKLVRLGLSAAGRSGSHDFLPVGERSARTREHHPDLEQELPRLGIDPGDSIISTTIPECLLHHSTTINIRELPEGPPQGWAGATARTERGGKELPTFCKIVRFGPSGPKNRCLFSSRCDLQGVANE